jgi:hypothetical protein
MGGFGLELLFSDVDKCWDANIQEVQVALNKCTLKAASVFVQTAANKLDDN